MNGKIILEDLKKLDKISNFEYLVCRIGADGTVSTEFSAEEFKHIYEVIYTLPFPINTNPLLTDKIRQLMTGIEYDLHTQEKLVIEVALKRISPDLHVIPFPKGLLQFYLARAIKNVKDDDWIPPLEPTTEGLITNIQNLDDAVRNFLRESFNKTVGERGSREHIISDIVENEKTAFNFFRGYCSGSFRLNLIQKTYTDTSESFKDLWHGLNKSLIKAIVSDQQCSSLQEFYNKFAKEQSDLYKNDNIKFNMCGEINDINTEIFNLLCMEINEIMFNPKYHNHLALFRGVINGYFGDIKNHEENIEIHGNTGEYTIDGLTSHSLSYSSLGGYMVLDTGATPLKFLLENSLRDPIVAGYVLFVNIPNFLNNELERALTWIPCTSSAITTLSAGEYHARLVGEGGFSSPNQSGFFNGVTKDNGNKSLRTDRLLHKKMFEAMVDWPNLHGKVLHYVLENSRLIIKGDNGLKLANGNKETMLWLYYKNEGLAKIKQKQDASPQSEKKLKSRL